MFSMIVVARRGIQFNAILLKNGEVFGGIGGNESGMFINIIEVLTLEENLVLSRFAWGIKDYSDLPCVITVRKEED